MPGVCCPGGSGREGAEFIELLFFEGFGCEKYSIYATFKAGQVFNNKIRSSFAQADSAGLLPFPLAACISERAQCFAAYAYPELAGAFCRCERGSPVVGTGVNIVPPAFRYVYAGRGIRYRYSGAVGKQIRRTHLLHKLLVQRPASVAVELLGLYENVLLG